MGQNSLLKMWFLTCLKILLFRMKPQQFILPVRPQFIQPHLLDLTLYHLPPSHCTSSHASLLSAPQTHQRVSLLGFLCLSRMLFPQFFKELAHSHPSIFNVIPQKATFYLKQTPASSQFLYHPFYSFMVLIMLMIYAIMKMYILDDTCLLFFFFPFYGCTFIIGKFSGQGWNVSCSWGLGHSHGNTVSEISL